MAVPYTFAGATSSIPLSQLDANFATAFTLGNTAIQLGNTVTTLNNMTLANVTISSGNVTITNVSVTTANVTTGNVTTLTSTNATLTNMSSGNVTITGGTINGTTLGATTAASANVTTLTTSSTVTLNGGTANGVAYLNGSKVLTTGSALTYDGTTLTADTASTTAANFRIENGSFNRVGSFRLTATGVEFDAFDQNNTASQRAFAWLSGGSEQMRLTSTGLGIGTSSPGQKLEVAGNILINTSGNPFAEIKTSGAGNNPYLKLTAASNSWTVQGTFSNANDDLLVLYNSTTLLDLDNAGNLGLGVTPSAWSQGRGFEVLNAGYGLWNGSGSPASIYMTANAYFNSGWKYGGTGQASHYYQYLGQHIWSTAASGTAGNTISFTQAMTLDASGNLGVGTTSIASGGAGTVNVNFHTPSSTSVYLKLSNSSTGNSASDGFDLIEDASGNAYLFNRENGAMLFGTNNTERARITSGGKWLVNTTSTAFPGIELIRQTVAADEAISVWNDTTTGDSGLIKFYTDAGVGRGSITYNRGGGVVAYNTTSDYRAKDIIGPVANPGATIDALKVYTGKMKGATIERPMMIAHEAQEVVPYAVTGEKDAVNEDGTPKYQQMDHQVLVPLLIAEIQSLRARVAALEAA